MICLELQYLAHSKSYTLSKTLKPATYRFTHVIDKETGTAESKDFTVAACIDHIVCVR